MIVERKNTLVVNFVDRDAPKPLPYELHEWIYDVFKFEEQELEMIQVNSYRRQVFIKCKDEKRVHKAIQDTNGECMFTHSTGQRSKVTITSAGLGFRSVKLFHVPPEMDSEFIKGQLAKFGTVLSMSIDSWSNTLRYKIRNGVRTVKMDLKAHIPSYIDLGNIKSYVSYDGQPVTCAYCNATGHLRNDCPKRRGIVQTPRAADAPAWSQLVQGHCPIRRVLPSAAQDPNMFTSEVSNTTADALLSTSSTGRELGATAEIPSLEHDETTLVITSPTDATAVQRDVPTADVTVSRSGTTLELRTGELPLQGDAVYTDDVTVPRSRTTLEDIPVGVSYVESHVPHVPAVSMDFTTDDSQSSLSAPLSSRDPRLKKRRQDEENVPSSKKKEKIGQPARSEYAADESPPS